jgi:hypothetical protein
MVTEGWMRKRPLTDSLVGKTALVCVVPKDKLTVNGPTKSWAGKGSSGKDVHRIFCSECGSPIAHDPDAAPEIIAIKGGTLSSEDKQKLKPVSPLTHFLSASLSCFGISFCWGNAAKP